MATSTPATSGIPLQEYRKDVPPGWIPGMADYPLRLYLERVKMWYRLYDGPDETVGPLIAGRLGGRAQKIALSLRLVDPHGNYDVGDAALVRLSVDEVRDPMNPNVILQHHIPSGVQALFNALKDAFGEGEQLRATQSLENFFDFRRGRLSLAEYTAEWNMRLEEAISHAGLDVNAVARTFLYFRGSQLPQRHVDDILMQIHGDLSRFSDARTLALRLAHRQGPDGQNMHYEQSEQFYIGDDEDWQWYEPWNEDGDAHYYEDDWGDGYYYDCDEYDEDGYWPDDQQEGQEDVDANGDIDPSPQQSQQAQQPTYFKKNLGIGCTVCGSKWHESSSCPMTSSNYGKGKSHGSDQRQPFRKGGKSKGKGKYGRPWSFGYRGKGKGKYGRPWSYGFRGKGKGYGKYYMDDYDQGGYERWSNEYFLERRDRAQLQLHHARTGMDFDVNHKEPSFSRMSSDRPTEAFDTKPTDSDGPAEPILKMSSSLTSATKNVAKTNAQSPTSTSSMSRPCKTLNFPTLSEHSTVYHQVRGHSHRGLLVDPGAGAGIIGSETLRDILEHVPLLKNNPTLVEWTERSTSVTGISGQGDSTLAHVTFPFHLSKKLMGSFSADVLGNEGSLCPALLPNPSLRRVHAWVLTEWFSNGDGLLVFQNQEKDGVSTDQLVLLRMLLTDSGHYILPIDQDFHEEESDQKEKVIFHMKAICEQSSSQWSDVHPTVQSLLCMQHQDGPSRVKPEQSELREDHSKDHWRIDEADKKLIRVHVRPRLALFVPQQEKCPVDISNIGRTRFSKIFYRDGSSEDRADEWPEDEHQKLLHDRWTGETIFDILPAQPEEHIVHDENETVFHEDDIAAYEGDFFPDHLPEEHVRYLHKRYAALPELFYTRTRKKVIRPDNVRSWMRSQPKGSRAHLWELCSGTGRLSLLALLSGLTVLFPVDLRYGWDIGYAPHQALLREVHETLCPGCLFMAPNCRPFSVSANRMPYEKMMAERAQEKPCIDFLQERARKQHQAGRGYIWEQPWPSAMWKELDLPGHCSRTDQCRYGAADEEGRPILKATGLDSNFELRYSCSLCRGHGGKPHAWLQGQVQGVNRTAIAAMYPERLCKSIARDIKLFCQRLQLFLEHDHGADQEKEDYYTCPRCKMGRLARDYEQHTFMPGECRYGKWPEDQKPKTIKQQVEERHPDHGKSPTQLFRDDAMRNTRLRQAKINSIPELPLDEEHSQILKHALMKILNAALKHIEENKDAYFHWLEDPVITHWIKTIFKPFMKVNGICTHIQPWKKPIPTPVLRIEDGHLRLMLRGNIWRWRMLQPEDLRELSNHQWHEPTDIDEDWLITLFGTESESSVEESKGASSSSTAKSSPSTPARTSRRAPATPAEAEEFAEPLINPYEVDAAEPEDGVDVAVDEDVAEEATETIVPAQTRTIKPTYDFRRVYQKLPQLATSNEASAKKLLLGLHERFFHAPIVDFRNILIRCGMPPEVLRLATDAVAACEICRKYVRATRRPMVKTNLALTFNDVIQIDIFYYKSDAYLLIVDEATRFKSGGTLQSRELSSILNALTNNWLRFFGPPRQLVADQETAIMTQEAGAEMDRLNIVRCPKGTTTGKEGKKHTGTGLVEKHVDLTKNCMNKIYEEALRYNITVEKDELFSEAMMAQNSTLNYGGYTPSMCVFGVLPRGFMNVDDINLAVEGSDPTNSTFERAARLRQIALSAAQSSVLEERIVRAGRTRPQHVDTSTMVPGTTQIEIFREDPANTGHGWRGPATLLDLDESNGTVIVKYQGRPYLMSIRHIRPFRGHFFLLDEHQLQEEAMLRLQSVVESSTPHRMHSLGHIYQKNSKTEAFEWKAFPPDMDFNNNEIMKDVRLIASHFKVPVFHGVRYGRALKTIHVPLHTKGILLCWPSGSKEYVLVEHINDKHINLKKEMHRVLDDICFIYIYTYVIFEDHQPLTITSRQSPQQQQFRQPHDSTLQPMQAEEVRDPASKRDEPETVTILEEPGVKRQRVFHNSMSLQDLFLRSLWWMLQRPMCVNWDPLCFFDQQAHDLGEPRLVDHTMKHHEQALFVLPCRTAATLYADLREGEIFRVDTDTDVLTEADLVSHWQEFEIADELEIRQFVEEQAFTKIAANQVTDDTVIVDCTWVRKFKRNADGSRKAKSRLCARGFLDPQRHEVPTRSTTATRLSQRLLLSMASIFQFVLQSWDVSGAFLKGFTFEKVRQLLQKKGIQTPMRKVAVIPPANVWRHLAKADPTFAVSEDELHLWMLLCEKPIYGLNDAPLAWQLNIHEHLESQGGVQSVLDENLFVWKSRSKVTALITTHVDDLAVCSNKKFLELQYAELTKKYGKVSLQHLPFSHCGCRYSATATGLRMDQKDFCMNLKEVHIENATNDERDLTKEEQSTLRSQLGGLLWLAATRLDLVADIGVLQSYVTKSKVKHLKAANQVIQRAKDPRFCDLGLIYQKFADNSKWRLACIHDASAPSKQRDYAQEGVLILLMEDRLPVTTSYEIDGIETSEELFGGRAHVLWSQGSRSKRISYSTSHGETLAAINGMESASLVALRLAELILPDRKPTLQQLAALQERGYDALPIDHHTDCRDLFELVSGEKTLPQDKAQRVYTLALKEARLCGRIRWFLLIPTQSMTADPLTKPMTSLPLLHLLSSGVVRFFNEGKHVILGKRLPRTEIEDETSLEYEDSKIIQALALTLPGMFPSGNRLLYFALLSSCLLPLVSSSSTTSGSSAGTCSTSDLNESTVAYEGWSTLFLLLSIFLSTFVTCLFCFCVFCCCCDRGNGKKHKSPKTLLDETKPSKYESKFEHADMSLVKIIEN